VGEARQDLTSQLQAATDGMNLNAVEAALADVNRRLANAERRQAQTIEAVSNEIRRMAEVMEKRLHTSGCIVQRQAGLQAHNHQTYM
jgi:hypothetical protein